jgi:hypothetical protein
MKTCYLSEKILCVRALPGVSHDVDDCLFGFLFRKMPAPKAFGEAFLEQTTPTAVQALNLLQELFRVEGGEEKRF